MSRTHVRTLVGGDLFVRNELLISALHAECGTALDITETFFGWPTEPFGPVAEVREASGTEEDMIALVPGIEVIVSEMAPVTQRVFDAADALKLVVICRGGPINVNLDAATAHGIPVCFSPARNAAATAEYTIGLMLAAMRKLAEGHRDLKNGRWRGDFYEYGNSGSEIEGKTIGLVGFGAIGSRVAKVLRAFGADVLVADPYVRPEQVEAVGATKSTLEEMLPRCQAISLHARLTPETHHIIGRDQIASLPKGAVLVNSARGGLLDYDAMCDALESGHLAGAALDVYDPEPPPADSRLFTVPNLVLSPHIAGCSRETAERAAVLAAAEVGRYLRGEPLAAVANPSVLKG